MSERFQHNGKTYIAYSGAHPKTLDGRPTTDAKGKGIYLRGEGHNPSMGEITEATAAWERILARRTGHA